MPNPRRCYALSVARTIAVISLVAAAGRVEAQETTREVRDRIESLLTVQYEHKMISSGQNFPTINVREQKRTEVLVLLANGLSPADIQKFFGWTNTELDTRIDDLMGAGLVKLRSDRRPTPTIMVMSREAVARHMPVDRSMVEETLGIIRNVLPQVRRMYSAMHGFRDIPFASASLLILSDVLLDNWQINDVERLFLKSGRPLRDGNRYYYSLQERASATATEAFGIYGNSYKGFDGITVGVYGNRRSANPVNFLSMNGAQIEELFGFRPDTIRAFKDELLRSVLAMARGNGAVAADYVEGLQRLGWVVGDQITVPVLTSEDNLVLKAMAATITQELVEVLQQYRGVLVDLYMSSPYADQVSFEEYFMWWYHLYYTAVTDSLIDLGHITIPPHGITTFLLVD